MRAVLLFGILVAALGGTARSARVHADEPTPEARLASLSWLEGTWRGASPGTGAWEAVYTSPSGGEVLSTNKEVRNDKVISFEFERFFIEDGIVVMTPYVKGVRSVAFELTVCEPAERRAVFENPEHDFPQRIEYRRTDDERLLIAVTAKREGRDIGFQLDLKRVEPKAAPQDRSPEDLLARLRQAVADKDVDAMLEIVLPEHRALLTWLVGVAAPQALLAREARRRKASTTDSSALRTLQDDLVALNKAYGVKSIDVHPSDSRVESLVGKTEQALAGVDYAAFLRDAVALMDAFDGKPFDALAFKVERVETLDDEAVIHTQQGGQTRAMTLMRRDGRWYLSMLPRK